MMVFLKIAKEQMKFLEDEVLYLIPKTNSIAEFCMTPIVDKSIKLTKYKERELKKIINRCLEITNILRQIKNFGES